MQGSNNWSYRVFGKGESEETCNAEMTTSVKSGKRLQSCLIRIPQLNTSDMTDMSNMFDGCTNLVAVPLLDTAKVTNMYQMFMNCSLLKSVEFTDTTKVTKMSYTFAYCSALTELPTLDTCNTTDISSMFINCSSLTDVPLLDAGKVESVNGMFTNCNALENFGGLKDLGKAYTSTSTNKNQYRLALNYSSKLTRESLMNVINNLYDLNLSYNVANGGTLYKQQLVIGGGNLSKLTADEIAIATNKGWNVS